MLYSWNLKTWGEKDVPQWNALLGVSFMMGLNLSIIAIIVDMTGIVSIFIDPLPKAAFVTFGIIILIINYFWLYHKGKYQQIADDYKKTETKKQRRINALLIWLYVIVSFYIPLLIIDLLR